MRACVRKRKYGGKGKNGRGRGREGMKGRGAGGRMLAQQKPKNIVERGAVSSKTEALENDVYLHMLMHRNTPCSVKIGQN